MLRSYCACLDGVSINMALLRSLWPPPLPPLPPVKKTGRRLLLFPMEIPQIPNLRTHQALPPKTQTTAATVI